MLNNILPPIGRIYSTSINIPLIGNQNIKYQRTKKLISEITLTGKINNLGYIYFDKYDPYKYTIDTKLDNILKKYKCTLSNPYYDDINDAIIFNININLIKFSKKLTLINNEYL
tara:strand:- start:5 stop:346 length:342 start_codon:yes stop_codon:yes gene_type:complete